MSISNRVEFCIEGEGKHKQLVVKIDGFRSDMSVAKYIGATLEDLLENEPQGSDEVWELVAKKWDVIANNNPATHDGVDAVDYRTCALCVIAERDKQIKDHSSLMCDHCPVGAMGFHHCGQLDFNVPANFEDNLHLLCTVWQNLTEEQRGTLMANAIEYRTSMSLVVQRRRNGVDVIRVVVDGNEIIEFNENTETAVLFDLTGG